MAEETKVAGATAKTRLRRRLRFLRTRVRELKMIGKALVSTKHPILVHIIPMRQCNLACTYCNEFDDFSKPVPLEEMKKRLDALADMGTSIITISGGEPLMHPNLDEVITLDGRLVMLSQYAVFQVNINSVLGSGVKDPEDALKIAHRAVELGFTSTVGIIHDNNGQLKPLGPREQEIFEEVMALGKRSFSRFNEFQHNVARGREHNWRCRSGSRYLYICEDGLVHWCSQQRGYPGIPLAQYTPEMRHREYSTVKFCAPRCTVSCVQQVGILDNWRNPQNLKPMPMTPQATPQAELVQIGHARGNS